MIIMGCDPGQMGAIAVMDSHGHIEAHKMPETLMDLITLIRSFELVQHCYLEKVHSMPGQGVSSSFKFGYNYGSLEALIVCAGIPLTKITPQTWQKSVGCLYTGTKKISKTEKKNINKKRAQELFPGIKMNHAIADALLIAEYGRRIQSGMN